jgi:hypothetical protein
VNVNLVKFNLLQLKVIFFFSFSFYLQKQIQGLYFSYIFIGPSKLFLLVKAPSSFNLPLHFLPKREFRYSKKVSVSLFSFFFLSSKGNSKLNNWCAFNHFFLYGESACCYLH